MSTNLNREDVVAVVVRLFAVFLFVLSLRFATSIAGTLVGGEAWPFWLIAFVIATELVLWLVSVLLWFFPLTVARMLLPVMRAESRVAVPTAWDEIALSVMGVWLIASALWSISYWLVFLIVARSAEHVGRIQYSPEHMAEMAATIVELVLGLGLALGAGGLAAMLRRLRGRARYTQVGATPVETPASALSELPVDGPAQSG